MLDSIHGGNAISSLLRAQSGSIAGLKNNPRATQAIIDQLKQSANAPRVPVIPKTGSAGSNLPRGSLVDVLT